MNIFSFIKSRVSIHDVISEYATLKKAGTYYKGRCPFHHEKTASFTVSPHKEIYYCFGCHSGGDVISFISKIENCSQIEAARFLAERYALEIPQEIEASELHTQDKLHYFDICQWVAQWCHNNLQKHPSAMQYLKSRGMSTASIDYFSVGYFPSGFSNIQALINYVKKENILVDDLIESNILIRGKSVLYSPFEDRIIFPIKDHLGRFCAFGGRIFKPNDTRAKYYNSRENSFFAKGSLLFGLDLAKKSIQAKGYAFLVEGYTDCIAMVQHGYPQTVATLGTACTLNHLKQLNRYAQRLYLLYDSDNAGEQAILRLAKLCWQANTELMVIHLPAGQDPASFLHAQNSLAKSIEQAKDIFLFYLESLGRGFTSKTLHEKVQLTRDFIETIRTLDDSLKQDFLLQKAAKTFDIPFESLKHELQKAISENQDSSSIPENNHVLELPTLEKRFFYAILQDIGLLKKLSDTYILSSLPAPLDIITQELWSYRDTNSFDFTDFFDSLKQDERQFVSGILLEQSDPISEDAFEQIVQQLYKKRWKIIVQQMKEHLAFAKQEGNTQKVERIMNHFQQLKQKILSTISPKP